MARRTLGAAWDVVEIPADLKASRRVPREADRSGRQMDETGSDIGPMRQVEDRLVRCDREMTYSDRP
jgi:hypothetical protein